MANKPLTFNLLSPEEMATYIEFANKWKKSLLSDAAKAADAEGKSLSPFRFLKNGGLSALFYTGKSAFYEARNRKGIDTDATDFFIGLALKYKCTSVDTKSFPNFPEDLNMQWIEPVMKSIHSND